MVFGANRRHNTFFNRGVELCHPLAERSNHALLTETSPALNWAWMPQKGRFISKRIAGWLKAGQNRSVSFFYAEGRGGLERDCLSVRHALKASAGARQSRFNLIGPIVSLPLTKVELDRHLAER